MMKYVIFIAQDFVQQKMVRSLTNNRELFSLAQVAGNLYTVRLNRLRTLCSKNS